MTAGPCTHAAGCRRRLPLAVVVLAWLAAAPPASAQDSCLPNAVNFDAWLNCRLARLVAATAGPSGGEKQADAPSISDDSPTLVDASSAPDFVGFGLTLLGLRNAPAQERETTAGGASITASAYSLLAAAHGRDPLADRDFYYDRRDWRRVSFTLGRQPARQDAVGVNSEATIAGVKLLLLDLREIGRDETLAEIQAAAAADAVGYANIDAAVKETLRAALGAPDATVAEFAAASLGLSTFRATLEEVDAELGRRIDAAILARIASALALRDAITAKVAEVKRRPQISMAWSASLRDATAPNQHRVQGIVDYSLAPRLNLTANAGLDLVDWKELARLPDVDTAVGRVAAELELGLADAGASLARRQPVTLALALDLQWKNTGATSRTHLKLELPVAGGLVIPISITWANRPELVQEKEVRGTFGFTIDTSQLAAALR